MKIVLMMIVMMMIVLMMLMMMMYVYDSEATYYPPPISQTGNKNYEWILTNNSTEIVFVMLQFRVIV
jgi:heme/copper-type cytochrome/quinol oxidase subunit 2